MVPQSSFVPQASRLGASCILCSTGSVRAGRSQTCLHAKRSPSLLAPEPEVSDQEAAERGLPLWDELMAFPEHLDRISSGQRASSSTSSRPVQQAPTSRSRPTALAAAEAYLQRECGLTERQACAVLEHALDWRFRHRGPPPHDASAQLKVHQACQRNLARVAEWLQHECGIQPGPQGVGAIFRRIPPLLMAHPRQTDKWDLRIVQLAAFHHTHRHCCIPQDYAGAPGLGAWAARQKVARQGGCLSPARLELLQALGFDFGERVEVTRLWEREFDHLLDWLLVKGEEVGTRLTWLGLEWGPLGGVRARRAALWVQMQRAAFHQGALPPKAAHRLEVVGMCWDPMGGLERERCWMEHLGRLALAIHVKRQAQLYPHEAEVAEQAADTLDTALREPEGPLQQDAAHPGSLEDWLPMEEEAALQLHADWWARCVAAEQLQPGEVEASLAEWLVTQRAAWGEGRLDLEQKLLLQLAGIRSRVVPEWQSRLLARLQNAQTQTVLQRTQWLSSADEEQDIVTRDLVRQPPLPLQGTPRSQQQAPTDPEWDPSPGRITPPGAAQLQQLQGALAYAAIMPWQQPAGSVRVAAAVQASSMLLITLEDLAVGSPALAVGIGWLIWLWLQILLALGQSAKGSGDQPELEP